MVAHIFTEKVFPLLLLPALRWQWYVEFGKAGIRELEFVLDLGDAERYLGLGLLGDDRLHIFVQARLDGLDFILIAVHERWHGDFFQLGDAVKSMGVFVGKWDQRCGHSHIDVQFSISSGKRRNNN